MELIRIKYARTPTFYFKNKKDFSYIGEEHIEFVEKYSREHRQTSRICLHKNEKDALHNMLIAHYRDNYIRPHKHLTNPKAYQILRGMMRMIGINDKGKKLFDKILGKEKILRIESNIYLLLLPLSEVCVFHEIVLGPFAGGGGNFMHILAT